MEDWSAIAAEVDEAIRSVADVSQANGYPATLRRETVTGGDPYDPGSGQTTVTLTTLYILDFEQLLRDINGTLINETRRTLTVGTGAGIVPLKSDTIAVGVAKEDIGAGTVWSAIDAVRPLAPVGVTVLYEIDLVA